jgi:hypothetical protein
MANGPNIGDLPSWIVVLLISLGIIWATSNGMLGSGYESLGQILLVAALGLGAFYFAVDIANKT